MEAINDYKYKCTCVICKQEFQARRINACLCSPDCKRERKKQHDTAYRSSEHGAAVRRKNRKSPVTLETRKRYEKTPAYKASKRRTYEHYRVTQKAQELERKRKLNYYYTHFSKKYNLYNPNAYKVTVEDIRTLFKADKCFYCGVDLSDSVKTVDHKVPVSRGGTNALTNLVISCLACNSQKGSKTCREYKGVDK